MFWQVTVLAFCVQTPGFKRDVGSQVEPSVGGLSLEPNGQRSRRKNCNPILARLILCSRCQLQGAWA